MQFYISKSLKPVMATGCEGNLPRLKNGYTSRMVAFSCWVATIAAMTKKQSVDAVILEANKRMMLCALPPQQVCLYPLTFPLALEI